MTVSKGGKARGVAAIARVAAAMGTLVAATMGGCGAPSERALGEGGARVLDTRAASTWDVNDVSVLYPLRKRFARGEQGRLPRLSEGLLSQAQFDAVLKAFARSFDLDFSTGTQSALMNSLDKWAVTAFRLDPCFRRLPGDACRPQVRVVAQAIVADETTTGDFALHLFYEPRASTADLLREMIRLRDTHAGADKGATLGKPLGVHPILGRPGGMASPFAKALKDEFLLAHLKPAGITEIAVSFIEPSRLQPWVFFRVTARDPSMPLDNSIFAFDPETSRNACGVENGRLICKRDLATGRIVDSDEKRGVNPAGRTPKGFDAQGRPYLDDFLTLTQTERDTRTYPSVTKDLAYWQDVVHRIEDPRATLAGGTNCASCHRAQSERVRFRGFFDLPASGPRAFVADAASGCTPGNGIDYVATGMKTFNVRMFGYTHDDPVVGQRVVNETLDVCAALKKVFR